MAAKLFDVLMGTALFTEAQANDILARYRDEGGSITELLVKDSFARED